MRAFLKLCVPLMTACALARGDAGVLIANGHDRPDASVLSLEEMEIDVRIDNGDARVSIRQIFANHSNSISDGTYVFALPVRAIVSDFAVWDDVTRIPGVIMERRRAAEVYNDLKWQSIDPGLLQVGDGGADEARRATEFRARIVPIPIGGTKRVSRAHSGREPAVAFRHPTAAGCVPDAAGGQAEDYFRTAVTTRVEGFSDRRQAFPVADCRTQCAHRAGEFHRRQFQNGRRLRRRLPAG